MTTTARVRVLFLGCGRAAHMHSRVLSGMPGVELAYASRDPGRAAELCAKHRGVGAYGSYQAGLDDREVSVVLVATPTATHRDLTLMSLDAGRHVIVEKPAFMTVADAEVVRAAAAAADRQVFVAENYIYKPIARELRDAVGSGSLGEVRFVSLNATRWQPAEGWRADPTLSGGGALFEAGVHWISFAARIGLELCAVSAQRVGGGTGPDLSSLTLLRYRNGAAGALSHSWEIRAPLGGARMSKVQGTRGAVTFESNGFASLTTGARRRARVYPRDPLGYRAMLVDFLESVRGGRPPFYTLAMAVRDLGWLEDAQAGLER